MEFKTLSNRYLDGYICEHILGWVTWTTPPDATGNLDTSSEILIESKPKLDELFKQGFTFPPKGRVHRSYLCPDYTTSLKYAIGLAKRVGLNIGLLSLPDNPRDICIKAIEYHQNITLVIQHELSEVDKITGTQACLHCDMVLSIGPGCNSSMAPGLCYETFDMMLQSGPDAVELFKDHKNIKTCNGR